MIYELSFYNKIRCEHDEKMEAIELIAGLVSLSGKARKFGLLSLEDDIIKINDYMTRKGLTMVIDGTDPEIVRKVLTHMMFSSSLDGIDLLKAAISIEGILSIQSGINPSTAGDLMSAFLGKDSRLWDEYLKSHSDEIERAYTQDENNAISDGNEVVSVNAVSGIIDFETITKFTDMHVQKILRETDSQDLALAMKGCSRDAASKIYKNMSDRAGKLLREDINFMESVSVEDIEFAQMKILNIALKLIESGDIVMPGGR